MTEKKRLIFTLFIYACNKKLNNSYIYINHIHAENCRNWMQEKAIGIERSKILKWWSNTTFFTMPNKNSFAEKNELSGRAII